MNYTGLRRYAVIVIGIAAVSHSPANGQECADFFPMEEGTVLKYVNYDRKERVTGYTEMSFLEKNDTPEGIAAVFESRHMDEDGEVIFENQAELECRGGVLYIDAGELIDPASMSAYSSMEIEIEGEHMELPMEAPAGTALEDGGVSAEIRSGGMKIMTLTVNVTNRKIAAREQVTTPAGTFDCIKYTYDGESKMGFVSVDYSGVDWYNPKYGTIRSESYDKKGRLSGLMVLEKVE